MKTKACILYLFLFFSSMMALATTGSDDPTNISMTAAPAFAQGEDSLFSFINQRLRYPVQAISAGIEGRVVVRFRVEVDGSLSDIAIQKSLETHCDQEALRVVRLLPRWTPGRLGGRDSAMYVGLPFMFRLLKANPPAGQLKPDPLLLVDGVIKPYEFLSDTLRLPKSDVLRIRILDDSAAVAPFGKAGRYGVVLVSTKKGNGEEEDFPFLSPMTEPDKTIKPTYATTKPQFPGGEAALVSFIKRNLRYPKDASEDRISGKVMARFTIKQDGRVADASILSSPDPSMSREALRLITSMPAWIPGTVGNKPADMYFTLPIHFRLNP